VIRQALQVQRDSFLYVALSFFHGFTLRVTTRHSEVQSEPEAPSAWFANETPKLVEFIALVAAIVGAGSTHAARCAGLAKRRKRTRGGSGSQSVLIAVERNNRKALADIPCAENR
jgi:hypothetical protein